MADRHASPSGMPEVTVCALGMSDDEHRSAQLEEAERALERANAALRARDEELERLRYVVSHDLRAPLRSIKAFGELFEEDCAEELSDEGRAYLSKMTGAAERMEQLLSGLLEYSRLSVSEPSFGPVDLQTIADDLVDDLEADVRAAGARVELGPLPTVRGAASELRALLHHLVSNALKYRDPERPLVVRVAGEPEGEGWRIEVTDNGIGFDPKLAARARTMFVQLHPRGAYEGVGLGLALCERVLERHGSRLDIQTKEGVGTKMFFVI